MSTRRSSFPLRTLGVAGAISLGLLAGCSSSDPNVAIPFAEDTNTGSSDFDDSGEITLLWQPVVVPDGQFTLSGLESSQTLSYDGEDYSMISELSMLPGLGEITTEVRRVSGRHFTFSGHSDPETIAGLEEFITVPGFVEVDVPDGEAFATQHEQFFGGTPASTADGYIDALEAAGAVIEARGDLITGTISSDALRSIPPKDLPPGLAFFGERAFEPVPDPLPEGVLFMVGEEELLDEVTPPELSFEMMIDGDTLLQIETIVEGTTTIGEIRGSWLATYGALDEVIEVPDTSAAEAFQQEIEEFADGFGQSVIAQALPDPDDVAEIEQILLDNPTTPCVISDALSFVAPATANDIEETALCFETEGLSRAAEIIRTITPAE